MPGFTLMPGCFGLKEDHHHHTRVPLDAAVEETSVRNTLRTLAVILATGIPFAAGQAATST
jgi:hypothetical protein